MLPPSVSSSYTAEDSLVGTCCSLTQNIAVPDPQTNVFGHPLLTRRTWVDLGDISYRQGPGYFHMAAEAYRGALQRAGDVFRPDQQVQ